ncbi:MAG: PEGA domain-containing protein [Gemmataceae bacterium]
MNVPDESFRSGPQSQDANGRSDSDKHGHSNPPEATQTTEELTIELTPEEIAALESLIDGTATDPGKVARQFAVNNKDMAQSVVRYLLSPAYMGDFLQVLNSLDMKASDVLSAAETLEREGEGIAYVRPIREASGGMLELFLEQEAPNPEPQQRINETSLKPVLWVTSAAVGLLFLVCVAAFFLQPSVDRSEEEPETCSLTKPKTPTDGYSIIRVESTPSGAEVFLNDKRLSLKTDLWLNLKPGNYRLLVKKGGYHAKKKTLMVKKGIKNMNCSLVLAPFKTTPLRKVQTVVLRTVPSNAQFEIPLLEVRGKTEAKLRLMPGGHLVKLVKPGYRVRIANLEVLPTNETQIFQYILTPEDTSTSTIRVLKLPPPQKASLAVRLGRGVDFGSVCIVLDRSARMKRKIGETTKWQLLLEALERTLSKLPTGTRLSVLAVNTKIVNKESCPDIIWLRRDQKWGREQVGMLLAKVSLLELKGNAPLSAAMSEAVGPKGFFSEKAKGPQTLIVLAGGAETSLSDPMKFPRNKLLHSRLKAIWKNPKLAVEVICLSDELGEMKRAEMQFSKGSQLGDYNYFHAAQKIKTLERVLGHALMPTVQLLDSSKKQIAALTLNQTNSMQPITVSIKSFQGKDLFIAGRGLSTSRLKLQAGDAMVLEIHDDNQGYYFRRGVAGHLPKKSVFGLSPTVVGPPKPRNVTAALAGMSFDIEKGLLEQMVCVNTIPSPKLNPGETLHASTPLLIWCELTQQDGKPVAELRWQRAFDYPGTTYRLQGQELSSGEQPVLRMWIANTKTSLPKGVSKTLDMTVRAASVGAFRREHRVPDNSDSISLQITNSRFETRRVPNADGKLVPKKCLVITTANPTRSPMMIRLSGAGHLGEEHTIKFNDTRYEAVFWGSKWEPEQELKLELISIKHFKTKSTEFQWKRLPNTKDGVIIPALPKLIK